MSNHHKQNPEKIGRKIVFRKTDSYLKRKNYNLVSKKKYRIKIAEIYSTKRRLETLKGHVTRSQRKFGDQLQFTNENIAQAEMERLLERLHKTEDHIDKMSETVGNDQQGQDFIAK